MADGASDYSMIVDNGEIINKSSSKSKNKGIFSNMFRKKSKDPTSKKDRDSRAESVTEMSPSQVVESQSEETEKRPI